MKEYEERYDVVPERRTEGPVREAISGAGPHRAGLAAFLEEGGFTALHHHV